MRYIKNQPFMGRGTTPTINFDITGIQALIEAPSGGTPPFVNAIQSARVSFQGMESYDKENYEETGEGLVLKDYAGSNTSDVTIEEGLLKVTLSADETRMFNSREKIMVSLRVELDNGADKPSTVLYCPPMYTYMGQVIWDGAGVNDNV